MPSGQEPDISTSVAVAARELPGKLAGLSLPRQVMVLAIWPFLEQMLSFLVTFVDTVLAGRLSVEATNAIALTGYVGWLAAMLQSGVGIGASAVIARAIGARHKAVANAALGQSMFLAIVWGSITGAVIFTCAPLLGRLTELTGFSYSWSVLYLWTTMPALPFSALVLVGGACLRGAGDTRTPFWIMVIVNIVNIVASVTFVTAPGPLGGYDLGGVAAGTAVAWGTGAVLMLLVLLRGLGGIRLHTHRLRPHWHTIRRVIRVGVPALFESVGHWLGNFLVLIIVGRMARILVVPAAMGAHIITFRIEAVSFLLGVALGTAAATLSGQYLGLGDPERARRAVCICWALGAAVMGAAGILFMAVPHWLVWIVTDEPELLALTPPLLIISGPIQVFFATYLVLAFAMRGAGDTRATMIMTFSCTYLIRVPLAYVLGLTFGLGLKGLWIGLCIEHVIRGLIFAARFLHGGWAKARV